MTERWRRLVYVGRKRINPNFYEAAAFEALKEGLRSGDLYAVGSRRYQNFESYLLPRARWEELREAGQARLAIAGSAEDYLDESRHRISDLLTMLRRDIGTAEGLSVDKDGGAAPDTARQGRSGGGRATPAAGSATTAADSAG
ncbi:MAG: hypothetical protein M3069_03415 [Chloroflexota bacterium]|nr:hypothetical protein [Chloroflexota bacterium]